MKNVLTAEMASYVLYLVAKGYNQQEAASILGLNNGRPSEVVNQKRFHNVSAPSEDCIPDELYLLIENHRKGEELRRQLRNHDALMPRGIKIVKNPVFDALLKNNKLQ